MKKNLKLHYNPSLSIKANATNCNVTEYAIRQYIQRNGIDRKFDNKVLLVNQISKLIINKPNITNKEISQLTGYSTRTISKYLKFIESGENIITKNVSKISTLYIDDNKRLIKSVSDNQHEILRDILSLHIPNKQFDCDLTASTLNFYKKGIPTPKSLFDKYPQSEQIKQLDEIEALSDNVFNSIMVDLPFIVRLKNNNSNSMIHDRFNSFTSVEELHQANDYIIKQSARVLCTEGVLVMKTMDTNYSGKQYFISNYVINRCYEFGLEIIDTFILIAKQKLMRKCTNQKYARKYHSYFLVFKANKYIS